MLRRLSEVKPAKGPHEANAGVEIKINTRLHARFLVAHHPEHPESGGNVIIGSFDFNTECLGLERHDAGIETSNPDLVQSAVKLFNAIWDDPSSEPLDKAYPE